MMLGNSNLMLAGSDTGSLLVITLAIIVLAVPVVLLAALPGIVAERRKHSKTTAIKVCGYLGFFSFGILWLIAIVWAFTEDNRRQAVTQGNATGCLVSCPWCAEQIQAAAIICKHCGREVRRTTPSSSPAQEPSTLSPGPATTKWRVIGVINGGKLAHTTVEADSAEAARLCVAKRFLEIRRVERTA